MRKNILLPTDFSDNAWNAIVYALKLFEEEACTFYLLHSTLMKFSTMSNLSNKLMGTIQDSANEELQELKDQMMFADDNTKHHYKTLISSEDITEAIKWSVKTYGIDLVVMGTKGATGAKEIFFGSNTTKVIQKMRLCPILVVPDEHDFVVPKQIAFPTDFNRFYIAKELTPLKEFTKLYNSKILILHINEEEALDGIQEYNMTNLDECLEHFDHSFHWMPKYTKKADEINVFIEDLEIELLALINYKHSIIEHILNEPIIKKIGYHPIVPVLIIPE